MTRRASVHIRVTDRDFGFKRLMELRRAVGGHVRVGVLADTTAGSERRGDDGITQAELAAIHEFGAPGANIPERSFLRRTYDENLPKIEAAVRRLAGQMVDGTIKGDKALGVLGAWFVGKVKARIAEGDGIPPPLSPVTIARKGSSRSLVDTGRLLAAITWKVVLAAVQVFE